MNLREFNIKNSKAIVKLLRTRRTPEDVIEAIANHEALLITEAFGIQTTATELMEEEV